MGESHYYLITITWEKDGEQSVLFEIDGSMDIGKCLCQLRKYVSGAEQTYVINKIEHIADFVFHTPQD